MPITLSIKNISIELDGFIPTNVYHELNDALSYAIPGAEYSEKYIAGDWDGFKRLFNRRTKTFPTGLLGIAAGILEKNNIPYGIKDLRTRPKAIKRFGLKKELNGRPIHPRPYQLQAVQLALIYGRGIIEIATGGGKSFIITMIVAKLGLPSVIYVNTKDLLYQMIDNLKAIDSDEPIVGQIGDGICKPNLITVATIQSVFKAMGVSYPKFDEEDQVEKEEFDDKTRELIVETVRNANVTIIDETQFLASDTFQLVANNAVNSFYKYGLSATAARSDNADIMLTAATGKKFFELGASELIRMKHLVAPDITILHMPREPKTIGPAISYSTIYKAKVSEHEPSNNTITQIAEYFYRRDMSVLILVQHISHGQILMNKLKTNIDSKLVEEFQEGRKKVRKIRDIEFLEGAVVTDKRKRVVALFKTKQIKIMIATTLADCGLDIPSLDVLIMASRGKSITRVPQRIGRVIRSSPGKERAFVFDFYDQAKYLNMQSKARQEIFEAEPEFRIHHFRVKERDELENYLKQLVALAPKA